MVTPNEWENPIQRALGLSHPTVTRKQMQKQSFGLALSSQGLSSGSVPLQSAASSLTPACLSPCPNSGPGPATTMSSSPRQAPLLAKLITSRSLCKKGSGFSFMGISLGVVPLPSAERRTCCQGWGQPRGSSQSRKHFRK